MRETLLSIKLNIKCTKLGFDSVYKIFLFIKRTLYLSQIPYVDVGYNQLMSKLNEIREEKKILFFVLQNYQQIKQNRKQDD